MQTIKVFYTSRHKIKKHIVPYDSNTLSYVEYIHKLEFDF